MNTDRKTTNHRAVHRLATLLTLLLLAVAPAATLAQETEEPPPPPWSGNLGLSYLATSGNSDTTSFGFDGEIKRIPDPWGLLFLANYLKATDSGDTTAERYGVSLRATRKLSERWELFGGAAAGRDRFAGFDFRGLLETGASYNALAGPTTFLRFDGGLTWTKEDRIAEENRDYLGAILGLDFAWKPKKDIALTQKLKYFPDFDRTSNWRIYSETAFQSTVTGPLAVKLSYEVRYQNLPVEGFDTTDTTTKASLVLSF